MSFAKAADHLAVEVGTAPSVRSIKRLVRDAGERCDLSRPRHDLGAVPALLIDGTRVPAGARYGRKAFSARGVELNIACAVMGRDRSGCRPKAHIELIGATVARPWSALEPAVRTCRDAGIVATDGDAGIDAMLERVVPRLPRQHCTFHIHHNVWHRLWQDGIPMAKRDAVIEQLLGPILNAKSRRASLEAVEESVRFAEDNGWDHTAIHLQRTAPHLATWRAVRRSQRPWRMPGRSRPEHTTSVLDRTMREVNRRVDPPGNRWVVEGVRAMANLLLGRRFDHPAWRDLWQDSGDVKTWAGLR
jgi:hypothetical protein